MEKTCRWLLVVMVHSWFGLTYASANGHHEEAAATMRRYQQAQQQQAVASRNSGISQHERAAQSTIRRLAKMGVNGQNSGHASCANLGSRYASDLNARVIQVQRTLNSPAGRSQDMSAWATSTYQGVVQTGDVYVRQLQQLGCRG